LQQQWSTPYTLNSIVIRVIFSKMLLESFLSNEWVNKCCDCIVRGICDRGWVQLLGDQWSIKQPRI
jgi:hypothetical protein